MFDSQLMFHSNATIAAGSSSAVDIGQGGTPLSGLWAVVFDAAGGTATAPGLTCAVESADSTGGPWVQVGVISGVVPTASAVTDAKINNYCRFWTRQRYVRLTTSGTGNLTGATAGVTHGAYYTPEQQAHS